MLLDVGLGDLLAVAHALRVDQRVLDLPLLGNLVVVLVRVEPAGDLGVGRGGGFPELVGGEVHDRELDLLVAALELRLHFLVAHRDPVGEDPLQLLHDDAAAHLLLELVRPERGSLDLEHLPVAGLADEAAVFLEGRERLDAGDDLLVAGLDAELLGFGERRLFLDQPLENPLVDAKLFQQALVHVAAVRVPVGLHLLEVDAPEPVHGNFPAVHTRDDVARGRRLVGVAAGHIEEDEGEHDEGKAPLQPAPVSAHPIEHRHQGILLRSAPGGGVETGIIARWEPAGSGGGRGGGGNGFRHGATETTEITENARRGGCDTGPSLAPGRRPGWRVGVRSPKTQAETSGRLRFRGSHAHPRARGARAQRHHLR